MKLVKPAPEVVRFVAETVGVILIAWGLAAIYWPLCPLFVGAALIAPGILGDAIERGRK